MSHGQLMAVSDLIAKAQHVVRLARAGEPYGELAADLRLMETKARDIVTDDHAIGLLDLLTEGLEALQTGDVPGAVEALGVDMSYAPPPPTVFGMIQDAIRLIKAGGNPDVDAIRTLIDSLAAKANAAGFDVQVNALALYRGCCDRLDVRDTRGAKEQMRKAAEAARE